MHNAAWSKPIARRSLLLASQEACVRSSKLLWWPRSSAEHTKQSFPGQHRNCLGERCALWWQKPSRQQAYLQLKAATSCLWSCSALLLHSRVRRMASCNVKGGKEGHPFQQCESRGCGNSRKGLCRGFPASSLMGQQALHVEETSACLNCNAPETPDRAPLPPKSEKERERGGEGESSSPPSPVQPTLKVYL